MTNHTDEILRNKMSSASPDELMDSFDESAIWEQVRHRSLEEKPAKKLFDKGNWRYAAILIVGLLLGFYLKSSKENVMLSARKVISNNIHTDTILLPQINPVAEPVITVAPVNITTPGTKKNVERKSMAAQEIPLVHEAVVEPPSPQEEVIVARTNEIAVVYLEDIERKSKPVAGISEKKSRRKLVGVSKHKANESSSQELPVRNLVYALNQ